MKKKLSLAVIVLLFFSLACGGGSQKKKGSNTPVKPKNRGTAMGMATILDNDKALARDRAIEDAKRKLVKKILGDTISGTSVMKNFRLVSTIVTSKSSGLVKDDKILEERADGNAYIVKIEGTVEPAAIKEAIEKAINDYGRPKFMVLVKEKIGYKRNYPGNTITEVVMQEIMTNMGFEMVDAAMTKSLMRRQRYKMNRAMAGNISKDVQKLLLESAGAEVVIIGEVTTSGGARIYGMSSKQTSMKIKAVDVYTAKILGAKFLTSAYPHINAEIAARKAIERGLRSRKGLGSKAKPGQFINQITTQFIKAATNRRIAINLSGLNYSEFRKLRNQMKYRVRGVRSITNIKQIGRAVKFDLYYAGKTMGFVDELKSKSPKFGFDVKVVESFPNRVTLRARKK